MESHFTDISVEYHDEFNLGLTDRTVAFIMEKDKIIMIISR